LVFGQKGVYFELYSVRLLFPETLQMLSKRCSYNCWYDICWYWCVQ